MSKIHLRANAKHSERAKSFCQTKVLNGKIYDNNRDKYRFMASEIVGFKTFREVEPSKRCMHCCDIGLIQRNKMRKEKGFSQVDNINAAWVEKEA